MSNNIRQELRSHVTCRDINVRYYLKYNMCDNKETYIDNFFIFKNRINQNISECRTGIPAGRFPILEYDCVRKNIN